MLLVKNGSRWSVIFYPSVLELAAYYMGQYNEAAFKLQEKIEMTQRESAIYKALLGDAEKNFPLTTWYQKQEAKFQEEFLKTGWIIGDTSKRKTD